jgi:octaprenyl-diphosphate synthase
MTHNQTKVREVAAKVAAQVEVAMHADLGNALQGCDPLLAEVLDYALFGGGKRIRPLLAVLSASVCGRQDKDVYLLAAALEYLHVATLIHDDVIDHAYERRGCEAVGQKYGMAAAILAGDWLHARSMHLIGQLTGSVGLSVFCQATGAMVDGEFLQLHYAADAEMGEAEYFAVIGRKTGSLIASTCTLGALFAGGSSEQQQALHCYGDKVGAAFQVVDDLLDYLGDQHMTGKKVGNDFIEGKITLPLIVAMEQAGAEERDELTALITGDRTQPAAYERLHALVEQFDGFALARQRAEVLVKEAVASLQLFSSADDTKSYELLAAIAGYILARNK